MRAILLISAITTTLVFHDWLFAVSKKVLFHDATAPTDQTATALDQQTRNLGTGSILELDRYDDPEYGFSVAIPAGWRRIVSADVDTADADDDQVWTEPGYAVGFESPQANLEDFFADYVLIEVLPGDDSGLFTSTAQDRKYLDTGKQQVSYDRLYIDSDSDDSIDVDLVIFQRGVQALGYTLGFYAIGEPANERALFEAFQVMLRTFIQTSDPFLII